MIRRSSILPVAVIGGAVLLAGVVRAEEKGVEWSALKTAKVTLEQGIAAAEQRGKPISAKFEMDDGKLQLSVYTAKDGKFWELNIDHATGKISKAEEIKEGEDLTAAKTQADAVARAKKSLRAATEEAVRANAGYRAVSVFPSIESGRAVAVVTLTGASGSKTVSESLE